MPSAEAKVQEAGGLTLTTLGRDGTAGIGPVREGASMNRSGLLIVLVFPLLLLASGFAVATDDAKLKAAPPLG